MMARHPAKALATAAAIAASAVLAAPLAQAAPRNQSSPGSLPPCSLVDGQPRIERLIISSDIIDREPVDWLNRLPRSVRTVFLFTELRDAQGETVLHDWFVDGKLISRADLDIGGPRWRTWSRIASYRLHGERLEVEASLGGRCLLASGSLWLDGRPVLPAQAADSGAESDHQAGERGADEPGNGAGTETGASAERAAGDADSQSWVDSVQKPSASGDGQSSAAFSPAHRLERRARLAMMTGDFESAHGLLSRALSSLPEEHPERSRLRDQLFFHLPLLRLDMQLYLHDKGGAEHTLGELINYLDSHPRRQELRRQLAEYAPRVARLRVAPGND